MSNGGLTLGERLDRIEATLEKLTQRVNYVIYVDRKSVV